MTWGYFDQTKGRNVLGAICVKIWLLLIRGLDLGAEIRGLIKSGCCILYVGWRNEWIGGGIDRYGCVHNDSQEARVMLGTKLHYVVPLEKDYIHSQSEACIKGHGHSIR